MKTHPLNRNMNNAEDAGRNVFQADHTQAEEGLR